MRRLVVVGSALGASLSLVVGGVCGAVLGLGGSSSEQAAATWRPAERVARAMPFHLDEAPPGVDVHVRPSTVSLLGRVASGASRRTAALGSAARSVVGAAVVPPGTAVLGGLGSHVSPSCSGTTDGNRVQVLYVREATTPSRWADLLPALRSDVADVDDTLALSSDTGGRRVRWVQDAACSPVVPEVVVPAGTLSQSDLTALISALDAQGLNRPDRKYLALADVARQCGIAETYQDDSPGSGNDNNGGVAMYARVDSACWTTDPGYHSVPAHELMHMLGAVQPSAPHHTRGGHCTDESDVMCYDDGSGQPMVATCTAPGSDALYDCGHDDYFDPGPSPTGYLARAWNTASSSFLDVVPPLGASAAPAPAAAPTASPTPTPSPSPVTPAPLIPAVVRVTLRAPATAYVGTALTVTATLTSPTGPLRAAQVRLQAASGTGTWRTVATTSAVAGSARFTVRAGTAGQVTLRALVPASATVVAAQSAVVAVRLRLAPSTLTATVAAAAGAARPVVLAARIASGGRGVAGQTVTLQQRTGTSPWRTLARRVTDARGAAAYQVRPARPTSYRWVFGGSPTLAPAVSRTASAG